MGLPAVPSGGCCWGRVVDFHRKTLTEREHLIATKGQHHVVPYTFQGQQIPVAPDAAPGAEAAVDPCVLEPAPPTEPTGELIGSCHRGHI